MNRQALLGHRDQRGAIMVVSLLLLLVMTVLALSASQSTTLQERMAGNARDSDLAFQAAEAGLRDSEAVIADVTRKVANPQPCGLTDACEIKVRSINFTPDLARGDAFWKDNTREYADSGKQIGEVISDPKIYTERRALVPDTLTGSQGIRPPSGVAYFTHTTRAKGGTETSTIVLQSVSAERYPK